LTKRASGVSFTSEPANSDGADSAERPVAAVAAEEEDQASPMSRASPMSGYTRRTGGAQRLTFHSLAKRVVEQEKDILGMEDDVEAHAGGFEMPIITYASSKGPGYRSDRKSIFGNNFMDEDESDDSSESPSNNLAGLKSPGKLGVSGNPPSASFPTMVSENSRNNETLFGTEEGSAGKNLSQRADGTPMSAATPNNQNNSPESEKDVGK
jgi:hypothetical protein